MDDLKNLIDEKLWDSIKRNYVYENYTGTILDSIQYLGDLIREKTGLESDGIQLVGDSFSGKNPKLKLNKLQTESENNVQKGVEFLLRGIYTGYRNPRSHTKFEDTKEDADAIIIFMNHLSKTISKSKGKFSVNTLITRIDDTDFVDNETYINHIMRYIPENKYYESVFELFKAKSNISINNLQHVFYRLLNKLSADMLKDIIGAVSEELRFTDSNDVVAQNVALFKKHWTLIEEDAKIRAENKLLKCLIFAELFLEGLNSGGYHAIRLVDIIESMTLRNQLVSILFNILSSGNEKQKRYVIRYFGMHLESLHDPDKHNLIDILNKGLKKMDEGIYELAIKYINDEGIKDGIAKYLKEYEDINILPF